MRSRVYETVRPSVCLTDRHEPVGLLPSARRYRSTTAGAVQQAPALSSKCGQCHVDSRRSCFVNQRRLLATFYRPLGQNFRTNEPRECRDDSLWLSLGKFGTFKVTGWCSFSDFRGKMIRLWLKNGTEFVTVNSLHLTKVVFITSTSAF